MNYKGQEIPDKIWVTKFEKESVKEFDSNDFDLTMEDLKELQMQLAAKAVELTQNGVEFKNLRLNFYATEYHDNDYGPDDESQCTVCFAYDRPETDEESKERINKKKKRIDEEIQRKEDDAKREAAKKEREIANAKATLEKYGILI